MSEHIDWRTYTGDLVRRYDRDRFLAYQFAPVEARPHLVALAALNFELAKIPEVVSEEITGRIRYQWWRDAIDEAAAGVTRYHGVAASLVPLLTETPLSRSDLDALVDARQAGLGSELFEDMTELEHHCRSTSGSLFIAETTVLGFGSSRDRRSAEDLGAAWAMVGLARAIPFLGRSSRFPVPHAEMLKGSLRRSDFTEAGWSETSSQEVKRLVDHAASLAGGVSPPAGCRVHLVLNAMREHFEKLFRRASWNPYEPGVQSASRLRLTLAALRGAYFRIPGSGR